MNSAFFMVKWYQMSQHPKFSCSNPALYGITPHFSWLNPYFSPFFMVKSVFFPIFHGDSDHPLTFQGWPSTTSAATWSSRRAPEATRSGSAEAGVALRPPGWSSARRRATTSRALWNNWRLFWGTQTDGVSGILMGYDCYFWWDIDGIFMVYL